MRKIYFLGLFILFFTERSYAQTEGPVNLDEAVRFLSFDMPEELKIKLKQTSDDSLLYVIPPYDSKISYWVINKWFYSNNDSSAILKFFASKKITFHDHQLQITLLALKQYLIYNTFDLESVYKKYIDIEAKWNWEYANRYILDTIQGKYIPKDINECIRHFEKKWSDSLKFIVKNKRESLFVSDTHLAVGMWIRNNWWLWKGSRLAKYFNDLGIEHPDDMSGIILTCFHRYLNRKELKIDDQVLRYQHYWKVVAPPNPATYPKQAVGFTISEKSFFTNKMRMTDCVQIASDSVNRTIWLYNYERGWVMSTREEFERVHKKHNFERWLNRIYRRRKS